MDRQSPFWLVWNPQGANPTMRHDSREAAQSEAERLARIAPGQRFYVLAALSVTEKVDVRTTHFDIMDLIDEVPF